jgi:hypothetical protein
MLLALNDIDVFAAALTRLAARGHSQCNGAADSTYPQNI